MFSNLKRHTLGDNAPIAWLGPMPEHWETARGKALFRRERREPLVGDGVVTCFRDGIVTLRSKRRLTGFTEAIQEHGYQRVLAGDLVIHAMDAFAGAVGVSDSDGKSSPVYAACTPRTTANPHYYAAAVREMARTGWIAALSTGVRERSTDFRFESFARQMLPVPPAEEQAAIVKYLRHAHARIDRVVAAKRKLIALLEDQKQCIIQQAVTRGLDPSVTRKESGIAWLGEIPDHWEQRRVGSLFREVTVKSVTGEETPLSMSQKLGLVPSDQVERSLSSESMMGGKLCEPNDLVLNRLKAHLGVFAIARQQGVISPDYTVLRPSAAADSAYYEYVLKSKAVRFELRVRAKGIVEGFWRLYTNDLYTIIVPAPPIDEQRLIVAHLAEVSREVSYTVGRILREIELLREFRARLTSDVVTGQVDIREIAASLPELTEELLDSADEQFSNGDEFIESELELAGANE